METKLKIILIATVGIIILIVFTLLVAKYLGPGPGPPAPPSSSWNCDSNTCVDPGTGEGQYSNKSDCQIDCKASPPPSPSWNCDHNTCLDPGTGNGKYKHKIVCQMACSKTPPAPPGPPGPPAPPVPPVPGGTTALARVNTDPGGLIVVKSPDDWANGKSALVTKAIHTHENTTDNSVMQRPITVAFMNGTYNVSPMLLTYFTALIGLGNSVIINGSVQVEGFTKTISNIFFRSLTNITLSQPLLYGSSQMCPIRFCNISGDCVLNGNVADVQTYGSGGFIADTKIKGKVTLGDGGGGGAQQFGFKNVSMNEFVNGQMNAVFVDSKVGGANVTTNCGSTVSQNVGVYSPFNGFDFRKKSIPKISSKNTPNYYVSKGSGTPVLATLITTSDDLLNHTFLENSVVLLSPNVYMGKIYETVTISKPGVTLMGFGWAILVGITVKIDAPNCTLACIVFDAAPLSQGQTSFVTVTQKGKSAELYDIAGRTTMGPGGSLSIYQPKVYVHTMFEVLADNVYMENVWLWRGDHWNQYVAQTPTPAPTGKSCLSDCIMKNTDCNQGVDASQTAPGGSPNACGSSCEANQNCYYWKQNGGWCGLYYKDNKLKLNKNLQNWGFTDCAKSPEGLSIGISTRVTNASCCNFPVAPSGGGGADCDGVHWVCSDGKGPMGWDDNYSTLTNSGQDNQNSIGLRVTGNGCVGLGLFVEHQTLYPILWEGNNGVLVFTQGETAYHDNNPDWDKNNIIKGYKPGIYMTTGKKAINLYYTGGGIYSIFNTTPTPAALSVYASDTSQITITNLVIGAWISSGGIQNTLYLNGKPAGRSVQNNQKLRFCSLNALKATD